MSFSGSTQFAVAVTVTGTCPELGLTESVQLGGRLTAGPTVTVFDAEPVSEKLLVACTAGWNVPWLVYWWGIGPKTVCAPLVTGMLVWLPSSQSSTIEVSAPCGSEQLPLAAKVRGTPPLFELKVSVQVGACGWGELTFTVLVTESL